MWRKVLALLLFAGVAKASPLPCSPVFIAGPQGRPIPAATAVFTNLDGSAVSAVWANLAGTVAFNGQIPVSQILQVFIEAGTYEVTVAGSGVTKVYKVTCGDGIATGVKVLSVSRTAVVLLNTTANAPTLFCPNDGSPCTQVFPDDTDSAVTFDFVAPSYTTSFKSILLSWHSQLGELGQSVFKLEWCTYVVGEKPCSPIGQNPSTFVSLTSGSFRRTDLLVLPVQWSLTWNPDDHVVVAITRVGTDGRDTLTSVFLENVRMELIR